MPDHDTSAGRARRLAAALEPVAGQVYFSPECHRNYEVLGFAPSPVELSGVAMPDGVAYFTSRGSVMGRVPGELVAAAFGVFDPAVVVPSVAAGWERVDATSICAARTDGAVGQLRRILGPEPDRLHRAIELLERANAELSLPGRPLYAGLVSLPRPDSDLGVAWRLADQLREFRGDAHVAAWTVAGFDGCEISLLTELYWGLPMRSYSRSRGWSAERFGVAEASLADQGLVAGGQLTDAGRSERERIEESTDHACRPILDGLGDDVDELVGILSGWSSAIRAALGYPASGPHELAEAFRSGS